MKTAILSGIFSLFLVSFGARSAPDPWVLVAAADDGNTKILAKGTTVKKTDKGVSFVIQYLIRDTPSQNYEVKYFQAYISRKVCSDGYGSLSFTPISGNKNEGFTSEYVSDGASVSSSVGDNLCSLVNN